MRKFKITGSTYISEITVSEGLYGDIIITKEKDIVILPRDSVEQVIDALQKIWHE